MELLLQTRDYFFPLLCVDNVACSSSSNSSSGCHELFYAPPEFAPELQDLSRKLSLLCDQALNPSASGGEDKRRSGSGFCAGAMGIRQISFLLKTHLKRAVDPMHRIKCFAEILYDFLGMVGDKAASRRREYKVLTSKTLTAFYSPILQTLTTCFSSIIMQLEDEESGVAVTATAIVFRSGKNGPDSNAFDGNPELGEQLHSIVKLFSKLVNVTKLEVSHTVLCSALRDGRAFLDSFLRHSKVLHSLFSTQRSTVVALLNTLQKATRQLHSICSYGKQKRDKSLAHEAPYLKRALESLIYKMKEMASDNKCLGAIWVGTLKNRNLDGTEMAAHEEEVYEEEYDSSSEAEEDARGGNVSEEDGLGLLSIINDCDGSEDETNNEEKYTHVSARIELHQGAKKRLSSPLGVIMDGVLNIVEEQAPKRVKRIIVASDDDSDNS